MKENSVVAIVPSNEEVRASLEIAKTFVEAGYWSDIKTVAQAFVKVQAGREWGIPPFSAMSAVHIIQGKPTMAANAIASKIKGSGKYDYRVKELTAQACAIEFYQGATSLGVERFTVEDAKAAGLLGNPTWQKYPRNMLFARAISNGARFYCADIFGGAVVYTPEEMGAQVNGETGEIVSLPASAVRVVPPLTITPQSPAPAPSAFKQAFERSDSTSEHDVVEPYVVEGEVVEEAEHSDPSDPNAIPTEVRAAGPEMVDAYINIRKSIRAAADLEALKAEWSAATAYLVGLGAPKRVGQLCSALLQARKAELTGQLSL